MAQNRSPWHGMGEVYILRHADDNDDDAKCDAEQVHRKIK